TLPGIRKWVEDLNEAGVGNLAQIPKLLVGNKTDATGRAVSTEQGQKFATELGALFCETSAKYSEGVNAAFMMLARSSRSPPVPTTLSVLINMWPQGNQKEKN